MRTQPRTLKTSREHPKPAENTQNRPRTLKTRQEHPKPGENTQIWMRTPKTSKENPKPAESMQNLSRKFSQTIQKLAIVILSPDQLEFLKTVAYINSYDQKQVLPNQTKPTDQTVQTKLVKTSVHNI